MGRKFRKLRFAALAALVCAITGSAQQKIERMTYEQRDAALQMLEFVRDTVKSRYYDPRLHGIDFEARYKAARDRAKQVDTLSEVYGIAAWLLEPLDDSHTFFIPPARPYRIENGWRMKFVGDHCYLTAVEPGSDAAALGLKPGDEVVGMEGFRMDRETAEKLYYSFQILAPRAGTRLVVATPNSAARELLVKANVQKMPKLLDLEFDWRDPDAIRRQKWQIVEMGKALAIWKMPGFVFDEKAVDEFIAETKKHEALILDLRSDPGGAEATLVRMLGSVFDRDVPVGEHVARSPEKPLVAKTRGTDKCFSGKLIVLIDSGSASAAEIFARVIQLEKRGTILGDRSSGSVMEARTFYGRSGTFTGIAYGIEVTVADLIMGDGKSLEKTGVTPDEIVLPTAEDLAAGRDPVLARAAKLAGVRLTPEQAGAMFPMIWESTK
jgi:carboxyl-terminal processing protease